MKMMIIHWNWGTLFSNPKSKSDPDSMGKLSPSIPLRSLDQAGISASSVAERAPFSPWQPLSGATGINSENSALALATGPNLHGMIWISLKAMVAQ